MKKYFFLFIVLLTVNLFAQSISLGPQIGMTKSEDSDNSKLTPNFAVRLSFLSFGIEGSVGYKEEEFADGAIKTKTYPINLTGFINLLPIINLEAGVGWQNTKIEYFKSLSTLSSITKTKPSYHAGFGTEFSLGNVILTGDLRYVFLDLELNNISTISKIKSNYYVLLVGLMFKL
ncbi:MAG: hypothetical protein N2321_00755 [Melioribacteraceae bacterium]|nr:hypothetical protein [Melioribacteraceae bacterium]